MKRADQLHLCAAHGCDRQILKRLLMCRDHWRMVPGDLQRAVWGTYRTGQEDDGQVSELYLEAVRDAVAAVDEAESARRSTDTEHCRTCRAPIIWARSEAGNREPLNADASVEGNVWLDDGVAHHLGPLELEAWDREERPLRLSHFATCPDADEWRRTG